MAVKQRGLASEVTGIGRNPDRLQRAVDLGAIDNWQIDLESGLTDADLIYIATPVSNVCDFVRRSVPFAKSGCIITDAGSTKKEICADADSILPDRLHFVGGHPMAGSEAAGIEVARPDLFENAAYILTPSSITDNEALGKIRLTAEKIGSNVLQMDPETHDRCAAVISHLPHIIAAALIGLADDYAVNDPQIFDMIAGSFKDMTRVAGSSPELWRDICISNSDGISEAAGRFANQLNQGLQAVIHKDAQAFENWFQRSKDIRDLHIKNINSSQE